MYKVSAFMLRHAPSAIIASGRKRQNYCHYERHVNVCPVEDLKAQQAIQARKNLSFKEFIEQGRE